ncbi:MAG: hypothetical protein HY519_01210 [Candidatus Aenigmarchaeota archaeon]|nr:hypothetical protein [Candidatus Aenigmarchaeota archaeon]
MLLLPFLVLISGCTGSPCIPLLCNQPIDEGSDIVVIKGLDAIPSEIAPGQQVKIVGYIENRGGSEIARLEAEIFDYCKGLFEIVDGNDGKKQIDKLLGRETRIVSWILRAKGDIALQTTCPSDGVKMKVTYSYTTSSITNIEFIAAVEMQRREEEGRFKEVSSTLTLGEGPLKPVVTIEDKQPVSTDSGITVISFQIKNHGDGFPTEATIDASKITFKENENAVLNIGAALTQCKGDAETGWGEIRLIQKASPKFFCKVEIPNGDYPIQFTEDIQASLDYQYEFRKSVTVTVKPKI